MELRGIEPLSEDLSIQASPITVPILSFPQLHAQGQAYNLGSFIYLLRPQSFGYRVSSHKSMPVLKL